jgi:hypothetical protein
MYMQLDDGKYTALRSSLLKAKGGDLQKEFLEAVRENQSFVEYMREQVPSSEGSAITLLREPLSEHEFKEPPRDTERTIYSSWPSLPPAVACRPTFWGQVSLAHIEAGCVMASYFAANGGRGQSGKGRIDYVLKNGSEKEIDSCVRTVLRQFSGLPEARGNRSVYVNCPFGRAWWRERLGAEVSETTGAALRDVLDVLRLSQQYWEEIVSLMVSRNSVIGHRSTRDVLVWALCEEKKKNSDSEALKANQLRRLCRILGVRAAWQEFGVLSKDEQRELVDDEIARVGAVGASSSEDELDEEGVFAEG